MKNFKSCLLIFILAEFLLSYAPAFAQNAPPVYSGVEGQITKYLCTPKTVAPSSNDYFKGTLDPLSNYQKTAAFGNTNSGVLYQCINQIYKFAIVVAAVIGVFFIVIAGYIYMSAEGNTESTNKAKDILVTTVTSLVILMGGYVLLKAINPDLIQFHNVQPPSISISTLSQLPTPETSPGITPSAIGRGTACQVATGFNCNESGTAQTCGQYSQYTQQFGGQIGNGVNGASILAAIMYHESRCRTDLVSSANAYGLMQMKIDTANTFKTQCGINENITPEWFKNNPGPSVCLAAQYLKYLSPKCGSDPGLLLSGYANGNCTTTPTCPRAVSEMLACYNP